MSLDIFDILFYHLGCLFTDFNDLSAFVGCWSSVLIRRIFYRILNVCPFDYTAFAVSGKFWDPVNRFSNTSWEAVVTPTDRSAIAV